MAGFEVRNFEAPDETRSPDKTMVANVQVGGVKVGRLTLQPGWRWSECIKPVVGTEWCEAHHLGVMLAGTLRIVHRDGSEGDVHPGEAYNVQPGHDAWVVGDETVVGVEFDPSTVETYATSS